MTIAEQFSPLEETVERLPNFCGAEGNVEQVVGSEDPVVAPRTPLQLDRLQAVFTIGLHMHQPLVPDPGRNLREAPLISNLAAMSQSSSGEARHNAEVFAECYGRIGEIVPELVAEGRQPRIMLDYSGTLLYGLRAMGRGDILERLRRVTCDPGLLGCVEWLGSMWGHPVASSTPPPDYMLHLRAWQQNFAALYGWQALTRVRGFSAPEMDLPNHPDVAYEYVKALKECGYRWLLVQEHTVETPQGESIRNVHQPHRLVARNSKGEEVSISGLIKTGGADTKLVAQMQPFYEAQGLQRQTLGEIDVPPIVTQIADGENGNVMMHEFPDGYRNAIRKFGTEGVVGVNGTEYLELLEQAGVREEMFPVMQPVRQARVFERITNWEPGAADKAIDEIKRDTRDFSMEGGSWTNDVSWVRGYHDVLNDMNRLSAEFHQRIDKAKVDKSSQPYRNALFHLLASQTSCYRYWGSGEWTEAGQEICRRGMEVLTHHFGA